MRIPVLAASVWCAAVAYGFTPDAQRVIHPVRDRIQLTSLNGTWDFRFQGEGEWRTCRVPGTWQTYPTGTVPTRPRRSARRT